MMEHFRRYLIFLRRSHNDGLFWNLPIFLLFISIIGIAMGFILDFLLPVNFLLNLIRGLIVMLAGSTLFSFLYLKAVAQDKKKLKADEYYQTMRERFSYRQRLNFSIAVGLLSSLFILLGDNSSLIFTFKAILLTTLILSLIAFSRRLRREFIKDIHEIPDLRDMAADAKKKEVLDEGQKK